MTIGSVIFFGVVGSNNAINVLNQSSLFVNIIKGHTPEVTFTVNRNEHHKGYYLTDGIYPSWSVLMKGVPLPEQEKHKIFSMKQSTLRKDVKCAFELLKKRFNILVIPDRSYSQCTLLGLIVRTCMFFVQHDLRWWAWRLLRWELSYYYFCRCSTYKLWGTGSLTSILHRDANWHQDWYFHTFNPTWSSMCGISSIRSLYIFIM
jgi:hypothetical protein